MKDARQPSFPATTSSSRFGSDSGGVLFALFKHAADSLLLTELAHLGVSTFHNLTLDLAFSTQVASFFDRTHSVGLLSIASATSSGGRGSHDWIGHENGVQVGRGHVGIAHISSDHTGCSLVESSHQATRHSVRG